MVPFSLFSHLCEIGFKTITSRHFATLLGSGRLQSKWQCFYSIFLIKTTCFGSEITLSRLPCNKIRGSNFFTERIKQTMDMEKV